MALKTRTLTNAGAPLRSPDGVALAGVRVTFTLSYFNSARDVWDAESLERVAGGPVSVTTDAQGEFTVNLWPNSRGNRNTKYLCHVHHPGVVDFAGTIDDVGAPLSWAAFMAGGTELTPTEISQLAAYIAQIEAARDAAQDAAAQAEDAADDAVSAHVAASDPHTQYLLRNDAAAVATTGSYSDLADRPPLGSAAEQDASAFATAAQGEKADTAVQPSDPRLTDSRTPTGGAGGVLSGTYPNPGFAVDMATQAELDAVSSAKVDKVAGKGLSTQDYSTAEKDKLAGIATGATANDTDAALRDRGTHTGTQAIGTVTGLQTALDGKEAAGAANSALSSHVAAPDPHPQYTTTAEAAAAAPVQSVAGRTGAVTLAKGDVGLGNVDNTADTAKPVSTAQQTALNLKANIASPTFTGTVNGITKSMVGLGNVDNTSDANKPVSTAQAAAIATATAIHPFLLIGA